MQKSGVVDFDKWYREAHVENTPWGSEDSPAVVTAAESGFERELSAELMGINLAYYRTLSFGISSQRCQVTLPSAIRTSKSCAIKNWVEAQTWETDRTRMRRTGRIPTDSIRNHP